jgi:hypothetical protein
MPQIEKKTMSLPVKLTDEEVRLRGVELAAVTQEINKVDEKRKEVAKEYKDKLDGLASKRDLLADAVNNRVESRQVEIYEVHSLGDATAKIYRADTNALVHSRALSESELKEAEEKARQPRLPLGEEEESAH